MRQTSSDLGSQASRSWSRDAAYGLDRIGPTLLAACLIAFIRIKKGSDAFTPLEIRGETILVDSAETEIRVVETNRTMTTRNGEP